MVLAVIRSVLDSGWTEILDRTPGIEKMSYERITEVMLSDFLERHPLVVQRINALRIIKDKDESISECMRRIHDGYLSAELNQAPLETLVLLHLLILLPADPLSEKIKSWLVEKMRQDPNIKCLDEVGAYIQSQESDFIARKGTGAQDKRVNHVKPQDGDVQKDPPKEYKCRICTKVHPKFKCKYECQHCSRKGHRSEQCWTKFPNLAPGYVAPPNPPAAVKPREQTPAIKKKGKRSRRSKSAGSDRGSDYESDPESPATPRGRRRTRHRSNRVRALEAAPMVGGGSSQPGSSSSWGHPQNKNLPPLKLFRIRTVSKVSEEDNLDGVADLFDGLEYGWKYEGIYELFEGLEYGKLSHFQRRVRKVLKVYRVNDGLREPIMKGRILGCSTNKYLRFVADTGSPVAIVPQSVAVKNKLSIFPPDEDEPDYAGASGTRLTVIGQSHMFVRFQEMKNTKEVKAIVVADEGDEVIIGLQTLIQWGIIPECFPLPMSLSDRVGSAREAPSFVRTVKEHKPERLVDIKERVGSWRTSIKFNQVTEEKFEEDHEREVYAHLRNKLIKQFDDVFKEDLDPDDRIDVPPVKISMKPGHEDVPLYNARVPISTPRYLEKAADKELARILKSGVLEEVTWPTKSACRAFFVQKPGSPDSDPKVRLVNNMKPIN